jgi:hypothetical protein
VHWKGFFRYGVSCENVVNASMEQVWVREGILSDFPNIAQRARPAQEAVAGWFRSTSESCLAAVFTDAIVEA